MDCGHFPKTLPPLAAASLTRKTNGSLCHLAWTSLSASLLLYLELFLLGKPKGKKATFQEKNPFLMFFPFPHTLLFTFQIKMVGKGKGERKA